MGVTLNRVASTSALAGNDDSDARCTGKHSMQQQRYSIADLPMPCDGSSWWKYFTPLLLSWAGSCEDPFGTNGQLDDMVSRIWESLYPDTMLGNQDKEIMLSMVHHFS